MPGKNETRVAVFLGGRSPEHDVSVITGLQALKAIDQERFVPSWPASYAAGLEAGPLWVMGWGIEAMVWCAGWVAALPGAVGRVPAIPTFAFVLMIVGGLWCALWSARWRLLGVVPIAIGLMLAPTGRRPDVLVGRGAGLVAVRTASGDLSALAGKGSNFELARWLEHDGDGDERDGTERRASCHFTSPRDRSRVKARRFSVRCRAMDRMMQPRIMTTTMVAGWSWSR